MENSWHLVRCRHSIDCVMKESKDSGSYIAEGERAYLGGKSPWVRAPAPGGKAEKDE